MKKTYSLSRLLACIAVAGLLLFALGTVLGAYAPPLQYEQQSLLLLQTARMIYTDGDTIYVATAANPGASATAAVWQIKKISTSGAMQTVTWANGDNRLNKAPVNGPTMAAMAYQ